MVNICKKCLVICDSVEPFPSTLLDHNKCCIPVLCSTTAAHCSWCPCVRVCVVGVWVWPGDFGMWQTFISSICWYDNAYHPISHISVSYPFLLISITLYLPSPFLYLNLLSIALQQIQRVRLEFSKRTLNVHVSISLSIFVIVLWFIERFAQHCID